MRSKQHFIFLGIAVCAALAVGLFLRHDREPSYQGKSLSEWSQQFINESDYTNWNLNTNCPSATAIRQIGANAIPFLLATLQTDHSLAFRIEHELGYRDLGGWYSAAKKRQKLLHASIAFHALGESGKEAIPTLMNLFQKGPNNQDVAVALAGIGSDGLPFLLAGLTNQQMNIRLSAINALGYSTHASTVTPALINSLGDSNFWVRLYAVGSLGRLHQEPELVIPALKQRLSDTDAMVRRQATIALGRFGQSATNAVPALINAMQDSDTGVRCDAIQAMLKISPNNEITLDVLCSGLRDTDLTVRSHCTDHLRKLKTENTNVVARLEHVALQDPDENARRRAHGILTNEAKDD